MQNKKFNARRTFNSFKPLRAEKTKIKTEAAIDATIMAALIVSIMANTAIAQVSAASLTQQAALQSPTQLIVNYELTHAPDSLKPGGSGTLIIVLQNTGGLPAKEVKANIPDTEEIKGGGSWNLGTIDAGQSRTIKTTLKADKNTYAGTHTITLLLDYTAYERNNNGGIDSHKESTNWDIPLRVYSDINFRINAEKNVFYKDVSDVLTLKCKVNSNIKDVSSVISSKCMSVIGSEEILFGDLSKEKEFILNYTIKPLSVGVCPFSLSFRYEDSSGNTNTEVVSLGVEFKRSDIDFKVSGVSYPPLSPGDSKEISVEVKNVGSTDAHEVSIDLGLDMEDVASLNPGIASQMAGEYPFVMIRSSENYFDRFLSGETRNLKFKISINNDAKVKSYEIPLKIRYYDGAGVLYTLRKSIGLEVKGDVDLAGRIDKSDISDAQKTGDVVVSIVNRGSSDVKFLNVILKDSDKYSIISKNEGYIGNLKSDDYDSVTYTINFRENSGSIPLNIVLEYRDNYNNKYEENLTLELKILSKSDLAGGNNAVLIIIVLSVLAVFGYFAYRKFIKK